MASLATGKGLSIAGTVLSSFGHLFGGAEEKKSSDAEAEQIRKRAAARRAEGNRGAIEERRQAQHKLSRAQAVAAASGASLADPTFVNLAGDIEAEGEYRALSRLYEASEESEGLEAAAQARKREGRAARLAGGIGAVSTILTGAETLKTKYGGKTT